jgi:hypothetical protein
MADPRLCYRIFGCTVATNLEFPGFAPLSAESPDFTFDVSHTRPVVLQHELDKSVCWLQNAQLSEFEIIPATRTIVCYPGPTATPDYTRYSFLNETFPLCLSLSQVVLHASAVLVAPSLAVGFIGTSGAGKSTLAASFGRHGFTLLADDCLPLVNHEGQVHCHPGLPDLRLRATVLARLGIPAASGKQIPRDDEKRQVSFSTITTPGVISPQLARIYRLMPNESGAAIEIRASEWNDGLRDLMDCTYRIGEPDRGQLAADFTRLTTLAATGLMRRLSYPHDFAELDRVRDAVLADVGASGRS